MSPDLPKLVIGVCALHNPRRIHDKKYTNAYFYGCAPSAGDIYFDHLTIRFTRGQLKEENHYYPFGLPMGDMGSTAAGFTPNRRKYQSNEYIKEAGLNWMDFNARQYDPQTGRFLSVNPLAASGGQDRFSPYAAMGNEPAAMVDPNGMQVYFTKPGGPPRDNNNVANDMLSDDGMVHNYLSSALMDWGGLGGSGQTQQQTNEEFWAKVLKAGAGTYTNDGHGNFVRSDGGQGSIEHTGSDAFDHSADAKGIMLSNVSVTGKKITAWSRFWSHLNHSVNDFLGDMDGLVAPGNDFDDFKKIYDDEKGGIRLTSKYMSGGQEQRVAGKNADSRSINVDGLALFFNAYRSIPTGVRWYEAISSITTGIDFGHHAYHRIFGGPDPEVTMPISEKTGNGYDTIIHVKFPGGYFGGSVIPKDSFPTYHYSGYKNYMEK